MSGTVRTRCRWVFALWLAAVVLPVSTAGAAKFRRPFSASIGVNYGYDNYSGGGCRDFACGSVCYDGHTGTDFPLSMGTAVVAPANGRVSATNSGCSDWGSLGNTCGGNCGNYVRIDHQDGTSTLFCHMQNGSIAVSEGQQVGCGDYLGRSASSGNSSGPHLHFGVYVSGSSRDPFSGSCSQSTSYWVGQGSYPHNVPSATCATTCACSPGQSQSESCGNCGTRSRTCNSSCQWGSWGACGGEGVCAPGAQQQEDCGNCGSRTRSCASSCSWGSWGACQGQGECSPGSVDEQACCDCGTQRRTCSNSCAWSSFSACAGPDPSGGTEACDTGEHGPCAAGIVRCIAGCRACRRTYEPQPETCDDVDNDCSGEVDEGEPSEMGDPLPQMAARLIDVGHPASLAAGSEGQGWAIFRNEGSRSWEPGELWLEATTTWENEPSRLRDPESWPAYGVAAVLDRSVAPGEAVSMALPLKVANDEEGPVRETFHLVDQGGWVLRCPAVHFDVSLTVRRAAESAEPSDAGPSDRHEDVGSDAGCSMPGPLGGSAGWVVSTAVVAVLAMRRRKRKS
jgi:hypothetical protein